MKGGITSGVVYPRAVAAFAERYRLRRVGGTSAGAIAAAAAAAAQLGRDRGGNSFDELRDLPERLGSPVAGDEGGPSVLASLFQPTPDARPLLRFATRLLDAESGWGRYSAALASAPVAAGVGGLSGLALLLPFLDEGVGLVVGVPVALAAAILLSGGLAVVALWRRASRTLPSQGFGVCTGMPGEGPGEALTPWLAALIDRLAGQDAADGPLTFRDLWGGDTPMSKTAVEFEVITTSVTHGRPYRVPFETDAFYFNARELEAYLPAAVVGWMVDHARPPSRGSGEPLPDGFHRMPRAADLPVVVAARLSLSFPLLISAVPLYAKDRSREDPADREALVRCWFTDGGLSSNFPVHLFDGPLPDGPTFALNLRDFPSDRDRQPDESDNVYYPASNRAAQLEQWTRLEDRGLAGFLGATLAAARNWSDTTLLRLPGYRDRVAHVRTDPDSEGGLHLDMAPDVIARLSARGEAAAHTLMNALVPGQGADDLPGARPMTWAGHRWVRYRTFMALLDQELRSFRELYEDAAPGEPSVRDLVESRPTKSRAPQRAYPWANNDQARFAQQETVELVAMVERWEASGQTFSEGAPKPDAALRVRPIL